MKLKAATLLESIIALSLLASVVSFSMLMQSRIIAAHTSEDKVQAWILSEESLDSFSRSGELNAELPVEWSLEEEVNERSDGIWRVSLEYYKGEVLIYTRIEYVQQKWS